MQRRRLGPAVQTTFSLKPASGMRHTLPSTCAQHRLGPRRVGRCSYGPKMTRVSVPMSSTKAVQHADAAEPLPMAQPPVVHDAADGGEDDDATFTTPLAVTDVDPSNYQGQLQDKLRRVRTMFTDLMPPGLSIEVFESPQTHYRMRAEFTVHRQDGQLYYVMFDAKHKPPARIRVDTFPVASRLVNELMQIVREECFTHPVLRERLFQVNFHTGLSGDSMVTLLYHRKLGQDWIDAAQGLRDKLAAAPSARGHKPQVIGRSRKQKVELDQGFIIERLCVNGREYVQKQVEGSFSQPNSTVCQHMLSWAQRVTQPQQHQQPPPEQVMEQSANVPCTDGAAAAAAGRGPTTDLLELYCGNGNFTVPLAQNFRRVVATEVSKAGVDAARYNMEANGVANVFLARMASEEFAQTMRERGTRRRLQGLESWEELQLKTILVDPPRAGLDDFTVQLLSEFDNIIYISCNPETLSANLQAISATHRIVRFAAFDAFPYTHHLECGAYLQRR